MFTFEFPERLNLADLSWSPHLDDVSRELELFVVRGAVAEATCRRVHVDVVANVVVVERKLSKQNLSFEQRFFKLLY